MKDYSVLLTCGEANMVVIHDAFDKGYQQGYEDGNKALCNCKDNMEVEYNRGLNDAWEAIKKITEIPITKRGFVFDLSPETDTSFFSLLKMLSVQEAIAKIKKYEEQQKQDTEIKVGDEVYLFDKNHPRVVTSIYNEGDEVNAIQITGNGKLAVNYVKELHRTGRTFPQIAEVLAEMRGESE